MIHIRVDDSPGNDHRRFACGIGPDLPAGDVYYFECEAGSRNADCQGCNPGGPRPIGTPISGLSGRQGQTGCSKFAEIAASWGYP